MKGVSTADAAKQLGVSQATIHLWSDIVGLNSAHQDNFVHDEEALDIFRTIRDLRQAERGYRTITRIIRRNHTPHSQEKTITVDTSDISSLPSVSETSTYLKQECVQNMLTDLKQAAQTAENLSKASEISPNSNHFPEMKSPHFVRFMEQVQWHHRKTQQELNTLKETLNVLTQQSQQMISQTELSHMRTDLYAFFQEKVNQV